MKNLKIPKILPNETKHEYFERAEKELNKLGYNSKLIYPMLKAFYENKTEIYLAIKSKIENDIIYK